MSACECAAVCVCVCWCASICVHMWDCIHFPFFLIQEEKHFSQPLSTAQSHSNEASHFVFFFQSSYASYTHIHIHTHTNTR